MSEPAPTPWHEDESFWHHLAPIIFSEKRWTSAAQEVDHILALTGIAPAPGSAVLDLPCGPGRHCLEFARRGFAVTGVDITQAYLDEARRRADAEGLPLELLCADMRRFSRLNHFDLAVNLFTSFGYFTDPRDDEQVARNILASLRPGGTLVMDLMGREVVARIFRPREWVELGDGGLLLEHREILHDWTWNRMRWIYIRDGVRHDHTLEVRLYSADQLKALLAGAGFEQVRVFGNYEGAPYDHEAQRLVVTARKPA